MKLIDELVYYRRRIMGLTLNDKGKKAYIDEVDDVFSELFGINNFATKFLEAKTPQKCNKILDRIDRKSFTKIIGTKEYYKIIAQLVVIRVEMTRKNKKAAMTDKELKKLYRKVINKLISKVEIELPTNGIDVKFLKSFYKDGYDYDDDEFYFGDDEDDIDEFDDMKEYFRGSAKPPKKSKKRTPWDEDDEDDFGFGYDDEDEDENEDNCDETASLLQSFIKEQGKVNKSLIKSINNLAAAPTLQSVPQPQPIPLPATTVKSDNSAIVASIKTLTNKIATMDAYNREANKTIAQSVIDLEKRIDDIEDYLSSDDDEDIGEEDLTEELTGGQPVPNGGTGLVRLAQTNVNRGSVTLDEIDNNIRNSMNNN